MAKQFTKKPVVITAYTFEEFLDYGKEFAPVESNRSEKGNPWHFIFKGCGVTQENDDHYILTNAKNGSVNITPNDMIIIGTTEGDVYPCNIETFKTLFDEITSDI